MSNSKTFIPTKSSGKHLDVYMSWWGMIGLGERGREWTLEEKVEQIAKAYGDLTFINTQVMTPFLVDAAAVELLHDMNKLANEYRVPVFIETHRGTITQDLIRTASYVQQLDNLPLTIDFSHYEHAMVPHYRRWWRDGMQRWLSAAREGARLPVVCELGPAPYAITVDEHAGRTQEISDRWSQSLLLKDLLRSIWLEANGSGSPEAG